jgi:membrane protein
MKSGKQRLPAKSLPERSLEAVQEAEQHVKPYKLFLLKCQNDWVFHLAQALAFSFLTALVSLATLFGGILGKFDFTRSALLWGVETLLPPPLASPVVEVFRTAFEKFAHAPLFLVILTLALAALLGSFFFSLLEGCFDLIYHLPPRPFLRRHLIALVMLVVFVILSSLIILAATAPLALLAMGPVPDPGTLAATPRVRLASSAISVLISALLFLAIFVFVPHRQFTLRLIGRYLRRSWRGTLIATVAMQVCLQFFPLYGTSSLNETVGQVGFALLLLLFFYLFGLSLLLGAEVNAFFAEGIRTPKHDLITRASEDS